MNKFIKKITLIALSAAMCLSLCACNTNLDTMLLMKKVYDSVEKTQSFEAEVKTTASAAYGKLPIKVKAESDVRCIIDPLQIELDNEIDLGLLGEVEAPVYVIGSDKALDVYVGVKFLGKDNWYHQSLPISEEYKLDAKSIIELFDEDSGRLTLGEEKQIAGQTAVQMSLTLPADMIAEALGTEADGMQDVVINVWVNKSSGQIMRVETELSGLCNLAVKATVGDSYGSITIKSLPVVMDIESVNTVKSITVPAEALNGEEAAEIFTA